MSLRTDVSVLYVDPRGPYPRLVADWWDEKRDARLYAGPNPVVAHPPCGPWGAWKHLCSKQDPSCGPRAIEQVRAFGGVLEHPRGSRLFDTLPKPGHLDGHGFTIEVDQCRWGFKARKLTWLYCVGVTVMGDVPPPRKPTHTLVNRKYNPGLPGLNSRARSITPIAFAEWLISLAAQARRKAA